MVSNQSNSIIIVLSIALVLLVAGLFINMQQIKKAEITGAATTFNATTTATIAEFFAINASTNLSANGIVFNITSLPTNASNATANYINVPTNNGTDMYLTVESDSNVNVDFCIKANTSLFTSGGSIINISNYTFANATNTNISFPGIDAQRVLREGPNFGNASFNRAPLQSDFYRFWLNVSAGQAAGTYVNQINFKGVRQGVSC
jgi:hypothetical protein